MPINSEDETVTGRSAGEGDRRAIRRSAVFAELSADCLDRLLEYSRLREFATGTRLFRSGERADHWFIILEGWVKLTRLDANGEEVVVMLFTSGESVAQAAIFDNGLYPVDAETVGHTRLLEIPARPFLHHLQQDPELIGAVFSSLSRRLRYLIGEIEQSRSRACHLRLVRLAPREKGGVELRLPLEKGLIARRLGMTPATLSRAFTRLAAEGVETRGGLVRIHEVAVLRRLCARPAQHCLSSN